MSATAEEAIPQLTLGWRLQMAMRHADLTAIDMAGELEVSRDTVARWIHDDTVPHRLFLQAWATRTGVNYDWLVGEDSPKPEARGDDTGRVGAGRRALTDNKKYGGHPPRRRAVGKAQGPADRPRSVSLPSIGAETHSYRWGYRGYCLGKRRMNSYLGVRTGLDCHPGSLFNHSPWVASSERSEG